jgi:hypothetical protein
MHTCGMDGCGVAALGDFKPLKKEDYDSNLEKPLQHHQASALRSRTLGIQLAEDYPSIGRKQGFMRSRKLQVSKREIPRKTSEIT